MLAEEGKLTRGRFGDAERFDQIEHRSVIVEMGDAESAHWIAERCVTHG